ncbi:hypothetical protein JL720_10390 [Aureococcus anophagefferens]|nr:hypothetical protein JL720_10390 [Aureococcus anophagefferens]
MESTKKRSSKKAALDMDARNKARMSSKKEGGILKRALGRDAQHPRPLRRRLPAAFGSLRARARGGGAALRYNLGSRHFASKADGEAGIGALKAAFRRLDRAIGGARSSRRCVDFAAELALWKWRKGARVEFKRRRLAKETEGGDAAAAEKSAD